MKRVNHSSMMKAYIVTIICAAMLLVFVGCNANNHHTMEPISSTNVPPISESNNAIPTEYQLRVKTDDAEILIDPEYVSADGINDIESAYWENHKLDIDSLQTIKFGHGWQMNILQSDGTETPLSFLGEPRSFVSRFAVMTLDGEYIYKHGRYEEIYAAIKSKQFDKLILSVSVRSPKEVADGIEAFHYVYILDCSHLSN